jgi:neuron navigator 3
LSNVTVLFFSNFYIIVTLRQTSLTLENLDLNQNFNCLMYTNHKEPVKSFLSKFLKRKLIKTESEEAFKREVVDSSNPDMIKIIDWIVSLWNYVNNFLEMNHSSEATLGV